MPTMASFAARTPFYNPSSSNDASKSSLSNSRDPPAHANDPVFSHVKDIISAAQPTFDPSISPNQYLEQAERCLQSAKSSVSFGKPDVAFREYLKASEIAINLIPRHKEYGFVDYNNQAWSRRYKALRQNVATMSTQMQGIRKIIEDNNNRHGTVQRTTTSGQDAIAATQNDQELSRRSSGTTLHSDGVVDVPESLRVERARPSNVPKTDHTRSGSNGSNDLSQRFARLRAGHSEAKPTLAMPDANDFQGTRIVDETLSNGVNGNYKPAGPRDMPTPSTAPLLPPKVPIPAASMPKPPDPTYSPINVQQGTSSIRVGYETHRPPTERKQNYYGQPIGPAASLPLQRAREENQPYRPRTPNGVNHAIVPKSNSSEIPHHDMVDAETLSDYIKKYNVLLIDVRERPLFDEGHIFATSIICIEPLSLKEGTSAYELEERLVISPDAEQLLFSRRNEFDLVVYYDQSTRDCNYLKGPPTRSRTPHLRALFDTLYEFNETKPLRDGRPPALLQGGLDAWVDLMGSHSLATSRTTATLGSTRQRQSALAQPPVRRQRITSTNSRFEIRDRRLRNYKFLDESEQQAWRQQAQQEQVKTDDGVQLSDGGYEEPEEDDEPPTSPFIPDYESFLRRFPSMAQQSMVQPQRRPVVPPRRHEFAPVPTIPSRPPPAAPRPSYSGQADIIQPQAPLARVTSSTRQPLYSTSASFRTRKIPRTGLTNFGVTCYMNAVLQCLSATIPLANFFLDESAYKGYVQHRNWKGSSGIMPEIFANVLRALWKGDVDMIKPTTFRNFCGRMNPEWVSEKQQDAKEFFDYLVDCLHEDLNVSWERTPLRPLTTEQELQREKYKITEASPIEWLRYEHRDRSFVSSLFAGQHASRLKCLTCHNTSTSYEPFYSVSIEIPRSGQGDIYSCLKSYTQEERLEHGELWKCPHCKVERDATKQIILTRLPQFLVIHFKRFSASKTESARKVHTPIDFPLHGLNMDPFILCPSPKEAPLPSNSDSSQPDPSATTPPFSYDAYAVLRHLGSSGSGGHYVSLVKDQGRGCWRKFDDERHYDFDPAQLNPKDRLQNSEAYIVFFQRSIPR